MWWWWGTHYNMGTGLKSHSVVEDYEPLVYRVGVKAKMGTCLELEPQLNPCPLWTLNILCHLCLHRLLTFAVCFMFDVLLLSGYTRLEGPPTAPI